MDLFETIMTVLMWVSVGFLWTRAFDAAFPVPPNWWETANECDSRTRDSAHSGGDFSANNDKIGAEFV